MKNNYRTIFFSSALMGGQQVISMGAGLVQAKVVAILLGSAGTGIFGVYASLLTLVQSLFSLGINDSSIRHIAAENDPEKKSVEIRIIWKVFLWMALAASCILFLFRKQISQLTFNNPDSAGAIGFIAAAVGVGIMTTALSATLQGLRQIKFLTLANITSTVVSAATSILLVYYFGAQGVAPAFLAASCCGLVASWYFCRRLPEVTSYAWAKGKSFETFRSLLHLGYGFMAQSLLTSAGAYLVRLLIIDKLGLGAAGLYQASWILTTFYTAMIFQAMRVDFFPRLSAVSDQNSLVTRYVNEQTEVTMLIAIPGLLVTLVAIPLLFRLLYTQEFIEASLAARWMLLGMVIRAGGFSVAYVPLAKSLPGVTIATTLLNVVIVVVCCVIGLEYWGLDGVGFAYFLSAPVYSTLHYLVARRLCSFRWSGKSLKLLMFLMTAAFLIFGLLMMPALKWATPVAWVATAVVTIACLLQALRLLNIMQKRKGLINADDNN